jgi:hypothetical protein
MRSRVGHGDPLWMSCLCSMYWYTKKACLIESMHASNEKLLMLRGLEQSEV